MISNLKKSISLEDIELHGDSFAKEIRYYLNKYQMTQKELSMRLGLSIKHVNSILNDAISDISVSVLEGLEYAFQLETGTLTTIYHIYSNLKSSKIHGYVEEQLRHFGINFIIEHPELSLPFNICITNKMPTHLKLLNLKRFYGVSSLNDYTSYLKEHVLAEQVKYLDKPNSYTWIRFCELSVKFNDQPIGVFRKGLFSPIMKKLLNIMSNKDLTFHKKIDEIKAYLITKGIVLVTKQFIEKSLIRGITLKKGGKRYIFLSDMYNTESYIFLALLHEIVHCYFPESSEVEIDQKVFEEYRYWESQTNTTYKAIYDAILSYEQASLIKKENPNTDTSYIWQLMQNKYPHVSFDDDIIDKWGKKQNDL
ncbi:helix-turn-helix domain-containing protein [[Mycoplasma] anseris]|uniref:XRE family transcriptional regulator n=1 Tax=[Mycoplasma] anseris TaxID=92400 RepID=A0A2Z4NC90_9BACT|nr:helix-turn-helix domain-containing protein [[Mycoplasma] anseris]AWX69166.1 XRE family transcriptional regulator [[Mycoplasma] anseris]